MSVTKSDVSQGSRIMNVEVDEGASVLLSHGDNRLSRVTVVTGIGRLGRPGRFALVPLEVIQQGENIFAADHIVVEKTRHPTAAEVEELKAFELRQFSSRRNCLPRRYQVAIDPSEYARSRGLPVLLG